jgi:hypothetical protein
VTAQLLTKDGFYTQLASTPDNELPTRVYHLHVETVAYVLPHLDSDSELQSELQLRNGGEGGSEESRCSVEYLVVTGLRGGGAKQLACNPKMRHLKLVPVRTIPIHTCIHTFMYSHNTINIVIQALFSYHLLY